MRPGPLGGLPGPPWAKSAFLWSTKQKPGSGGKRETGPLLDAAVQQKGQRWFMFDLHTTLAPVDLFLWGNIHFPVLCLLSLSRGGCAIV